jgi:hypothetical protein
MWIEPVRVNSIPSSAASDERPSRPFSRAIGVDAITHRAHTTSPSAVRS